MARTASKKTQYQAAAEKAIRDQLKARKELVGKIGDAEEAYEKQREAVEDAQKLLDTRAAEFAQAYNAAIDGGWTVAELKDLGITRPDAKAAKPSKNSPAAGGSKASDAGDPAAEKTDRDHPANAAHNTDGQSENGGDTAVSEHINHANQPEPAYQ